MTAQQVISQIVQWLRTAIQVMVLLAAAVILATSFGFHLPIGKVIGAYDLCLLAGAYYLSRS